MVCHGGHGHGGGRDCNGGEGMDVALPLLWWLDLGLDFGLGHLVFGAGCYCTRCLCITIMLESKTCSIW